MECTNKISYQKALEKLICGNQKYVDSGKNCGDFSQTKRFETVKNGQHPYAVIICCSDSRVIPETIFQAGIGELFVIRVAGNVIDNHQLGSVEYAVSHLGCNLVVMLGHTHCGAVTAAVSGHSEGFIKTITDKILVATKNEKDIETACKMNVLYGAKLVADTLGYSEEDCEVKVSSAIYNIETGKVEFL